jgi:hypothetical protein
MVECSELIPYTLDSSLLSFRLEEFQSIWITSPPVSQRNNNDVYLRVSPSYGLLDSYAKSIWESESGSHVFIQYKNHIWKLSISKGECKDESVLESITPCTRTIHQHVKQLLYIGGSRFIVVVSSESSEVCLFELDLDLDSFSYINIFSHTQGSQTIQDIWYLTWDTNKKILIGVLSYKDSGVSHPFIMWKSTGGIHWNHQVFTRNIFTCNIKNQFFLKSGESHLRVYCFHPEIGHCMEVCVPQTIETYREEPPYLESNVYRQKFQRIWNLENQWIAGIQWSGSGSGSGVIHLIQTSQENNCIELAINTSNPNPIDIHSFSWGCLIVLWIPLFEDRRREPFPIFGDPGMTNQYPYTLRVGVFLWSDLEKFIIQRERESSSLSSSSSSCIILEIEWIERKISIQSPTMYAPFFHSACHWVPGEEYGVLSVYSTNSQRDGFHSYIPELHPEDTREGSVILGAFRVLSNPSRIRWYPLLDGGGIFASRILNLSLSDSQKGGILLFQPDGFQKIERLCSWGRRRDTLLFWRESVDYFKTQQIYPNISEEDFRKFYREVRRRRIFGRERLTIEQVMEEQRKDI